MRFLLLAVTAFALALAQLAPTAHIALVRHVVCAEHGEPVHAPEGDAPAEDEHEHCAVAMTGGSRALEPQHAGHVVGDAPDHPSPVAQAAAPRIPSVALYRLAPKNSPPSRA